MHTSRRLGRLAYIFLAVLSLGSCTQLGVRSGDSGNSPRATELFASLQANQAEGRLAEAARDAHELMLNHPGFAAIDEVTFRAGEIAAARGLFADAAGHFERVASAYPTSSLRAPALLGAARAQAQIERPDSAASVLLRLLQSPVEPELRDEAAAELRNLVRVRLNAAQLEALVQKYPGSELGREIALQVARKEYANGNYDGAYELLSEYLYRYPEGADAAEARRLLRAAAQRRESPRHEESTPVDPNTIGVVLPVTGPGARHGRLFEMGIETALEHHNASSRRQVVLARADSKASPIGAVKALRRLLQEDGAVGVVGAVFTMPTIATAIEASAWGVPLLSPVVSNDEMLELGPWVFQTKVPLEVEVTAVAEAACRDLMIERFAIVGPSRGTGRELADLFRAEVGRMGREVVAAEFYEDGATDFREQLEALREAAPDAIFAPGSIDELLLLLPQVKFYDLQIQLLGLSNWNSDKLLRLSRDELEGALFPRESYRGKDPGAFTRFREALAQKGVTEVSPIAEAGYFGMEVVLRALDRGASSRDELRDMLAEELLPGAEGRVAEARTLPLLRVRGGRVLDFNPSGN